MRCAIPAVVALLFFCVSIARADDKSDVIQATRDFINAVRSLDVERVKSLHAPAKGAEDSLDAAVRYIVAIQKVRLIAEEKFGPEPDFSEEAEAWSWGIAPESIVDYALKNYPDCVQIETETATVMIPPGFEFTKVDGRWLIVIDDSYTAFNEANIIDRAIKHLAEIEADLIAGKISTIEQTRDRVARALQIE